VFQETHESILEFREAILGFWDSWNTNLQVLHGIMVIV